MSQSEPVLSRETFERLADEWLRERPRGIDIVQLTRHPAYQDIIGLGESAVPWILQRLAHKPDHWFVGLSTIGMNKLRGLSGWRAAATTSSWGRCSACPPRPRP